MLKILNKKFGRLFAVKHLGGTQWLFRCDCGSLKTLRGSLVAGGHTSSCGCLKKDSSGKNKINHTGKKYGKLTAIKSLYSNKTGQIIWLFRCDCGKEKELLATQVKYGRIKSCGCARVESSKSKALDLVGKRFAYLKVIERIGSDKNQKALWKLHCDCGKIITAVTGDIVSGKVISCGTWTKPTEARFGHIWHGVIYRTSHKTKHYGERGITVCEAWKDYTNFYNDLYTKYIEHAMIHGEKDTTLDRINVNGNYEPNNVRWATYKVQANNKQRHVKNVSAVN